MPGFLRVSALIFPAGSAAFHGGFPVRENSAETYGLQGVASCDIVKKDKFEVVWTWQIFFRPDVMFSKSSRV